MSVVGYKKGFECVFGSIKVPTSSIDDSSFTCKTPEFSKSKETTFTIAIDDTKYYYLNTKTSKIFIEDQISIESVIPSVIDQSAPSVLLRANLLNSITVKKMGALVCKLQKNIPGAIFNIWSIQVPGELKNSGYAIECLCPTN